MSDTEPHSRSSSTDHTVTRRRIFGWLGAGATLVVAACTRRPWPGGTTTTTAPGGTCVLTPQQIEGPFYTPEVLVRRAIAEDHRGVPLRLALRVEDASCAPLPGAAVDVWHCDAEGAYSSSTLDPGSTHTTFCRGIQDTDATGMAEFATIYPGWYQGRAVHIHIKVHVEGQGTDRVVHTGQLYFEDAVNDRVFATAAPYNARTGTAGRVRNAADTIYRNGGASSLVRLTPEGDGYRGDITIAVRA